MVLRSSPPASASSACRFFATSRGSGRARSTGNPIFDRAQHTIKTQLKIAPEIYPASLSCWQSPCDRPATFAGEGGVENDGREHLPNQTGRTHGRNFHASEGGARQARVARREDAGAPRKAQEDRERPSGEPGLPPAFHQIPGV